MTDNVRSQSRVGWICPLCKQARNADYNDPCISNLPGVLDACCGHGGHGDTPGYIHFENGICIKMTVTEISYRDRRKRITVPGNHHRKPTVAS